MRRPLFTRLASCLLALAAPLATGGEEHETHDHDDHTCTGHGAEPFGFNLTDHWLDQWEHRHFSRSGTPYVHFFGFEPAYTGRDGLLTYGWSDLDEGEEQEIELELEWAFTRRLGIVLEQGYIFEDPDGEDDVDGWGDIAIVPRAILMEFDRFVATLNLEIEAPTGSESVGAGEEWRLAPSLSTWCDLGRWWTVSTNTGFEFALDSEETEFFFALGLAKAIRLHEGSAGAKDAHGHDTPRGILALIAELYGAVVIDGEEDEEDEWALEALVGVSYGVSALFDVRAGYSFPLNNNSELNHGLRVGLIHHF